MPRPHLVCAVLGALTIALALPTVAGATGETYRWATQTLIGVTDDSYLTLATQRSQESAYAFDEELALERRALADGALRQRQVLRSTHHVAPEAGEVWQVEEIEAAPLSLGELLAAHHARYVFPNKWKDQVILGDAGLVVRTTTGEALIMALETLERYLDPLPSPTERAAEELRLQVAESYSAPAHYFFLIETDVRATEFSYGQAIVPIAKADFKAAHRRSRAGDQ